MDINLTPIRTMDYSIAYQIANHPVIHAAFTEDGAGEEIPDVVNECWILMMTDAGEIAGAYNLKAYLARTWEIHAFMLPEYRDEYAKLSGYRILQWCMEFLPFDKLVTTIPQTSKHIWNFVKLYGFKDEGFNRSCFMKNGKLHGMYHVGITRDEIAETLEAYSNE